MSTSRAVCPHCWPNAPTFEAGDPQSAAAAVWAHIKEHHPIEAGQVTARATASYTPVRTYQATVTGGLRVIYPSRYRSREPRPKRSAKP